MFPRNNASPPIIAVGQVILIADGSVVTSDASARVKIGTGDWGASAIMPLKYLSAVRCNDKFAADVYGLYVVASVALLTALM